MTRHRLFPAILTGEPETTRDQAITRPGAGTGTFLFLHQTAPALTVSQDSRDTGAYPIKNMGFSHADVSGESTRYEPHDRKLPGAWAQAKNSPLIVPADSEGCRTPGELTGIWQEDTMKTEKNVTSTRDSDMITSMRKQVSTLRPAVMRSDRTAAFSESNSRILLQRVRDNCRNQIRKRFLPKTPVPDPSGSDAG